MADFSVLSSTISPSDIAKFVVKKYSLAPGTTCRLLKAGINHTYLIDSDEDRFIFRVYSHNWRTVEEIEEELRLLEILKENNVSISFAIADVAGSLIQELKAPEGLRYGVLFTFAPGNKILNFNKETHFEIGKMMALIHKQTKDLELRRVQYNADILLHNSLHHIRQFLDDDVEEMQFLLKTIPILEAELLNADASQLRKGVVHLDIWFDNLNITEHNEVNLFDFDFCGNGWLCIDIAYYVFQLHNTEREESIRIEKMDAFYEGYNMIEKISEEEMRLLPTLGVCLFIFYLGIQCSRFENWSNTFVNEVYLKRFITVFVKGGYERVNLI